MSDGAEPGSKSFTAKDSKDAEEEESFTAKEIIIRTRATPEGREGTAPRVAYRNAPGHTAAEIKSFLLGIRMLTACPDSTLGAVLGGLRVGF
jgi:hypothetical protein